MRILNALETIGEFVWILLMGAFLLPGALLCLVYCDLFPFAGCQSHIDQYFFVVSGIFYLIAGIVLVARYVCKRIKRSKK